jgi:hypothetical protein
LRAQLCSHRSKFHPLRAVHSFNFYLVPRRLCSAGNGCI